ncbi:cell envelope integrity EipB family protein [Niveispirillum lacus]|uniref:cell envelope integrity EipB family protein n=1 Tax=Niveispirillum lacus TaxID=1981099 RepID=UPI0013FDFD05|nr:cell envelope integrity EipB family protein [Niveispirillum lacus]
MTVSAPLRRSTRRVTAFALALLLGGASIVPAQARSAIDIAPHKATYRLTLDHARLQSGITDVSGQMTFSWNDACDGWTIDQRFQVRFSYAEGEDMNLITNYATWEAKDGSAYRFNVRKLVNGEVDEELSGGATLDGRDGGNVRYDKPESRTMPLKAGTMFPTAHTLRVLKQAGSQENLFSVPVFDGAEAEGASPVNTIVGKLRSPAAMKVKDADLLAAKAWQVSLAFFPINPGEPLPDYETNMVLQENGVVRSMLVDYGDFRVSMELETLEKAIKPPC